ncbi:DNA adenine methylase [Parabacteroides sp. FAFU027]|uniref:DNA adenine methylase n=1 Tax=Parabacteroides sp. FAFU027 TaxID=2922715 RepID=UPI001FAEE5F0|nr:DNA adenine methylase [Parabacteroides sp. FAFU027]
MISRTENNYSDTTVLNIVEDGYQLKLDFAANKYNYDLEIPEIRSVNTDTIYRPIQYLGTKYRPLPIILSKTIEAIKPNSYVLDMFSGSSVVSQVFNLNGLNVISNDAMKFTYAFTKTLLNIDRKEADLKILQIVFDKLRAFKLHDNYTTPFQDNILLEKKFLQEKQTEKLIELYLGLPQVSKVLFLNGNNKHEQTKTIVNNIGKSAIGNCPLIANYYAGSYFGIFQALELDRLRNGIEYLLSKNEISNWQYHFLLTCLLNVSSKIVYTAGKHFAQPIKHENTLKTKVLHKRFYEDRKKDVWSEFLKSASSLELISKKNCFSNSNIAISKTMEEIISDSSFLPPISVIYADPPYTAQQYSRFYHIPEIIFNYTYPQLQIINGKATAGLYPENKFKSRFCSKQDAYFAFVDLFKLAAKLESSLIISYSSSLSQETGNLRMIELEQIMELGEYYLPMCSHETLKFNFQYRQLNTTKKIVQSKDDKEFLIIFKQPTT